jgi:hypothetical protein
VLRRTTRRSGAVSLPICFVRYSRPERQQRKRSCSDVCVKRRIKTNRRLAQAPLQPPTNRRKSEARSSKLETTPTKSREHAKTFGVTKCSARERFRSSRRKRIRNELPLRSYLFRISCFEFRICPLCRGGASAPEIQQEVTPTQVASGQRKQSCSGVRRGGRRVKANRRLAQAPLQPKNCRAGASPAGHLGRTIRSRSI